MDLEPVRGVNVIIAPTDALGPGLPSLGTSDGCAETIVVVCACDRNAGGAVVDTLRIITTVCAWAHQPG